jgi:hypothetical protein
MLIALYFLQILCFWTLSIFPILFKTQRFGDCILSPSAGWAQTSLSPDEPETDTRFCLRLQVESTEMDPID